MYSAVLVLALTSGADSIEFGRRGCNCSGCYGCHGCCGGRSYGGCCCGGYSSAAYYGSTYAPGPYYAQAPNGAPNVVARGPSTDVRESYYPKPGEVPARIRIIVPNPDAQIWFDDAPTRQRGMERVYSSPPLDPNGKYKYAVKAQWTEGGRTVERERNIDIQPGQVRTFDFRVEPAEKLSGPKMPKEKK